MSFAHHLQGYQLTTAEITYHRPDHPNLLQEFIWQRLDLVPEFPHLIEFLQFWDSELDGKLHSVRVATSEILKPTEYRWTDGLLRIH